MKKYECPYCGEQSLRVGQKLNVGTNLTKRHHTCSNCGKTVALKRHWVCFVLFLTMVLFLILTLVFKSYLFLGLFVFLYIAYDIACILLSEFVKSE